MHGNLSEWTADAWNDNLSGGADPYFAGDAGSLRVLRGGSWNNFAAFCRSAFRYRLDPSHSNVSIGLRLALSVSDDTIISSGSNIISDQSQNEVASYIDQGAKPANQPVISAELAKLPADAQIKLPPIENSIGMKFKLIPSGEFIMGDDKIKVKLSKSFYVAIYEVTQEQYEKVMGINPSKFIGTSLPVEKVSWNDAMEFCKRLSSLPEEKTAGRVYTLPTEAQWEYSCLAGTQTAYSFGDDPGILGDYAWFKDNSNSQTHPVAQKKPNAWGLYDMHGNVWEWTADAAVNNKPGGIDPYVTGESGSYRVVRGGGWSFDAAGCRSANRGWFDPSDRIEDGGFRLALSVSDNTTISSGSNIISDQSQNEVATSIDQGAKPANQPVTFAELAKLPADAQIKLPPIENSIGIKFKLVLQLRFAEFVRSATVMTPTEVTDDGFSFARYLERSVSPTTLAA